MIEPSLKPPSEGSCQSCWDRYKGAGAASMLSLGTASLFVLRSKQPSTTCNEVVLWWSELGKEVVNGMNAPSNYLGIDNEPYEDVFV